MFMKLLRVLNVQSFLLLSNMPALELQRKSERGLGDNDNPNYLEKGWVRIPHHKAESSQLKGRGVERVSSVVPETCRISRHALGLILCQVARQMIVQVKENLTEEGTIVQYRVKNVNLDPRPHYDGKHGALPRLNTRLQRRGANRFQSLGQPLPVGFRRLRAGPLE